MSLEKEDFLLVALKLSVSPVGSEPRPCSAFSWVNVASYRSVMK